MKKLSVFIIILLIILIITVIIQPYFKNLELFQQEIDVIGYESEKFPKYNGYTSSFKPQLPSDLKTQPQPMNITSGSDRIQSYSEYQQQQNEQQKQR